MCNLLGVYSAEQLNYIAGTWNNFKFHACTVFFGNLAIFDFLPCCTGEVLICFGQLLWRSNNGIFRATFGSGWLNSFGSKSVPSRVLCTTVLDYECKSSRLLNLRPKQIRTCIQYGSPILTCNLSIRSYFHSWSCTLHVSFQPTALLVIGYYNNA